MASLLLSDYSGIEFTHYYCHPYCDETSNRVFSLFDTDFTLDATKALIESHIDEMFNHGADDAYFILYENRGTSKYGTSMNIKDLLNMIGGENYYDEIYDRFVKMDFHSQLYGMSIEDLESMRDCVCEYHGSIIQEYIDELKAKIES